MRGRTFAVAFVLALATTGCGGGDDNTRTVLADYSNDEFASVYLAYFPHRVQVHPGDTVVFKQTWTGEPHTVTMGKLVEPLGKAMGQYLPKYYEKGFGALPEEEPKEVADAFKRIPPVFEEESYNVAQNGGQPCYLEAGTPPTDTKTPCRKRTQPAFTGRESFYNSGYIHYAGAQGNIFRVPIAANATPGSYYYFCIVHGPLMAGYIDIKPEDEEIPDQEDVTRQASREISRFSKPLEKAWSAAKAGRLRVPPDAGLVTPQSPYVKGNLAGLGAQPGDPEYEAFINEFVPRNIRAKAGQSITWTVFGGHTISFNVPRYFPIISVQKDGTVVFNPKLIPPAGGAPPLPEPSEDGPPVVKIDGGTYDGTGFWSSGLIEAFGGAAQYTLRISRPGTYRYACLVHPPMVGRITITP